jgi:hypothetical protein
LNPHNLIESVDATTFFVNNDESAQLSFGSTRKLPVVKHRVTMSLTPHQQPPKQAPLQQQHQQGHPPTSGTQVSPLVESLISGDRAGVGGILANDVNGLCLVCRGDIPMNHETGVYTNLTRLASKLTPYASVASSSSTAAQNSSPLITIEMEGSASILIKEYDGHTVAIKVPNATNDKSLNC